ncbi:FHA domain-containing protein [bacterium]|nr:FHA domain-containing protein [bacterium]
MSKLEGAHLIPRNPQPGMPSSYPLKGEQTTLGRHPTNDIVLALDSISRFHARIDCRGDFFIIQDLNSSNGSFVNGERITQLAVHHGDYVTFGNVEFEFQNASQHATAGSASASSMVGMEIIDIRDDRETGKPTTQSFIKVEDAAGKNKSSVISSVDDKKADKAAVIRLNQRLASLYKLSELLREMGAENESESDTLVKVLALIFQAVPADRGVFLTRYHEDSEQFEVAAVKYRDDPIVPTKVRVSRTILDQVLKERVSILSRDAMSDERFNSSESIIAAKVQSAICCPMIMGGKVLGVVFIETSQASRVLSQEDLEFVTIVASEAGVAISNMRMQKEAMHRQRLAAVGETVAGISHNVKNILVLSQGGADLLTRALEKNDPKSAREAWSVVSRGIDKIGKLVVEMLEYSSNKKPDLTLLNINDLICLIAEEIEDKLIAKSIVLELVLDDNIPPRPLDKLGMQRTLMNLFVNGMEAINHPEGEIVVTTAQRSDGMLVISVKDNGSGISAEKLPKIFLPFFTTKGSAGTGLGLPMCKKCIEDMNGTIRVESQENVGTKFTMEIPLLQAT